MANGGKDNERFRTATLVNWHLLPEVQLTPGGFAQMQPAEWPEGIDSGAVTLEQVKINASRVVRMARALTQE